MQGLLASSQPAKEFMPAWGYDAVELDATMVLVLMDHQIVRLSPERLKTMQKEEYLRLLQVRIRSHRFGLETLNKFWLCTC